VAPKHVDRRTSYADALGRKPPERLSEYFDFQRWPEKAALNVKRIELLAILERDYQMRRQGAWHRVVWRWLRARVGSGPVARVPEKPATPPPPTPEVTP
jgi:hypothetical protein